MLIWWLSCEISRGVYKLVWILMVIKRKYVKDIKELSDSYLRFIRISLQDFCRQHPISYPKIRYQFSLSLLVISLRDNLEYSYFQKHLVMRLRIAYKVDDKDILEEGQVSNFPRNLWCWTGRESVKMVINCPPPPTLILHFVCCFNFLILFFSIQSIWRVLICSSAIDGWSCLPGVSIQNPINITMETPISHVSESLFRVGWFVHYFQVIVRGFCL